MFRFIHTADWQIAKSFANIPVETSAHLRTRRIEAIKRIAQLATERKADAVLVAGDVFDSNTADGKSIRQTFQAMDDFDGAWVLLPGNHDSAEPKSIWTRLTQFTGSPRIKLATEPTPIYLCDGRAVILPAPLKRRHEVRDVTDWYDTFTDSNDPIRVGLAHGSIEGAVSERGEAPNTISSNRVLSASLDYLALGDWHGTRRIDERTWYSGTPEPDRFKSNDAGNVLFVEIPSHGMRPQVEKISTLHYLWHQDTVQVFSLDDVARLKDGLRSKGVPLERILFRLELEGTVPCEVFAQIDSHIEDLKTELAHFEVEKSKLMGYPTRQELDEIERTGYVRSAIDKLVSIADGDGQDADTAKLALQILYLEHKKMELAR